MKESLDEAHWTQVPIIVDHQHKFISFGSTEPQLCFRYVLSDPAGGIPDIVFFQRLIFNLAWSPDKFQESNQTVEDFVESGELEFFLVNRSAVECAQKQKNWKHTGN